MSNSLDLLLESTTHSSDCLRLRATVLRRSTTCDQFGTETYKRNQAEQYLNSGNFMKAWELYDEIGDRLSAQHAMEQAYRSSRGSNNSKPWAACEVIPREMDRAAEPKPDSFAVERQYPSTFDVLMASEQRHLTSDEFDCRHSNTSDILKASSSWGPTSLAPLWTRPSSSTSQASTAASERSGVAKMLRTKLGINQRKVYKVKDLYRQGAKDGAPMSKVDFQGVLRSLLMEIEQIDVDTSFSEIDADDDGFVTELEFVEWLTHA